QSILSFLTGEPVRGGPKGSIGFCLGGRLGLCAAGLYPDEFRATASLHGTRLVHEGADSPHRYAERFRGEIYGGFGDHDPLAPPATIETLSKLLDGRANVRYRSIVHAGTHHGYSLPDRDIFDKASANRDWERIFAMYRRQLVP